MMAQAIRWLRVFNQKVEERGITRPAVSFTRAHELLDSIRYWTYNEDPYRGMSAIQELREELNRLERTINAE